MGGKVTLDDDSTTSTQRRVPGDSTATEGRRSSARARNQTGIASGFARGRARSVGRIRSIAFADAASPSALRARGPEASLLRDSIFRRSLLVGDLLSLLVAFAAVPAFGSRPAQLGWLFLIDIAPLVVGAKLLGLYDRDDALLRKTTLEETPRLFQLATMCTLVAWLAGGLVTGPQTSRHQVIMLWGLLVVMLTFMRAVARHVAHRISPEERCLFVGDSASAATIRAKLGERRGGVRAAMVAHVDLDHIAPWSVDAHSHSRLEEVRDLAQELDVQRAIVAPQTADGAEVINLVRTLKAVGVRVSVLPRLHEVIGSSVEFDDLHGVTVMGVKRFELTRSTASLKRAFDVVCAGLALTVAAPLMVIVAIAIKLDSKGTVFFRQQRVGRHGKRFDILKFRTMVADAEAMKDSLRSQNETMGLFKIAADPRITKVGKLLRKTALDELPQLLNVVKGEMSIVGPRPLVIEEDSRVQGWHRRRLELTPGMTGPWQILGPTRVPLQEMVSIDYLYVANWSLWNDIKILLRTVSYVICARGM